MKIKKVYIIIVIIINYKGININYKGSIYYKSNKYKL